MDFLKELKISDQYIELINTNFPDRAKQEIIAKKDLVASNIKYLKDLGINNYDVAFVKFYNMFLLDHTTFTNIFNKYDDEDLIEKLEKNVDIMEYL